VIVTPAVELEVDNLCIGVTGDLVVTAQAFELVEVAEVADVVRGRVQEARCTKIGRIIVSASMVPWMPSMERSVSVPIEESPVCSARGHVHVDAARGRAKAV